MLWTDSIKRLEELVPIEVTDSQYVIVPVEDLDLYVVNKEEIIYRVNSLDLSGINNFMFEVTSCSSDIEECSSRWLACKEIVHIFRMTKETILEALKID